MSEYDDEETSHLYGVALIETIVLKHEPAIPARKTIYGEGIFVEHWQRFLTQTPEHGDGYRNEMFMVVFGDLFETPQPMDATAAASFMCWLGCNLGEHFVDMGRKYGETLGDLEEGYALAWAMKNRRIAHYNHGVRTIEVMIPAERITVRAVEVVETAARWLGTTQGQTFVKAAQVELEETRRQVQERSRVVERARLRALGLVQQEGVV